ncbi:MAG: hypothetical protein ACXAD7_06860 [Candidatus Kariarchaeaceae archaeon]|jgi:hypothetical protein
MSFVGLKKSPITDEITKSKSDPIIKFSSCSPIFEKWMVEARKRIFSIAAGNRIGKIAPQIMEVGFGKVLYAADQMGADIDSSNPYVFFAPDGTCSYNPIRTQRGFSYGAVLNLEFDGLTATSNSMPNGCGFTMYELVDPMPDPDLIEYLTNAQLKLGQDQLSQLGKGNHFAGLYYVNDPVTGEDTNRRFVVIHCSGHVGGHKLYHPNSWLEGVDGYYEVPTPHGPITLLEGEARRLYVGQYKETDTANTENRDITMSEIFDDQLWTKLEAITHQGFLYNGSQHIIGTQRHNGLIPVAFNPEEGLVAMKTKPNLSSSFLDYWNQGERVKNLGLNRDFQDLNLTPHGAGYEFRYPIKSVDIHLGPEGIFDFTLDLKAPDAHMSFTYFREIREWMTYRRRAPIMREVDRADLAEIKFEMPSLMQIYPLQSIPGGSHG